MFDKVIARLTLIVALLSSSFAFLLHAGCRASNYQVDVFNRFCYSDLAVYVQEGVVAFSSNSPAVAPLSHLLLWVLGGIAGFEVKLIVLQLLMTIALVATSLLFQIWRNKNTFDGVLFALLPLTMLSVFTGFDILAIAISMFAIKLFRANPQSPFPWILFAVAIGFDGWSWIVIAAVVAHGWMNEQLPLMLSRFPIFIVSLGIINLPIALTTRDFFSITPTFSDGTGLYVLSQIANFTPPTNFIPYFFGLGVLIAITIWLKFASEHNHIRLEVVLLLFVVVQTFTTNVIGPSEVLHVLWALLLAYPIKKFVIAISGIFTLWVAAVWLYAEELVGDRGLDVTWYVVSAIVMWASVLWCGIKAAEIVHTPGTDPVLNGKV
ncbi:MAG: hypothetical protein RIS09_472 [Actinomycetota bacterium]|jgi:hypothetical protein